MAIVPEQLHAEAVNRAEERAIESGLNGRRPMFFENALPCPLLHFVGSAMGKGDDDKVRQDVDGVCGSRELDDALSDRVRFARAGGSDHGKIAIELSSEPAPGRMVSQLVHQNISSSSRTSEMWTSRSCRMSRTFAKFPP